ncbi:hypothetical protein LguiB_008049 [Lonicera macranthoides]
MEEEQRSSSSSSSSLPLLLKFNNKKEKTIIRHSQQLTGGGGGGGGSSIDLIGEDLLHNILSRLPALSFASASCVSRAWNLVCDRLLSRPKLLSALSLNPSLQGALSEVFHKVLSEPIRPHFAIASIGRSFSLQHAHHLIATKLGSTTPLVTTVPHGIIGRDALTNEFKEIQWEITEEEYPSDSFIQPPNTNRAIVLTVGYLPGLKVDAIPLWHSNEERVADADGFVTDIREYTNSVSGCKSPAGIIMFADHETDMQPVLQKIDYAMSPGTVVVGDGSCQFLYRGDCRKNTARSPHCSVTAVALLFMRDRDKPHGIGETQFHVTLSTGISPIGPTYKAVSVREKCDDSSTWLTAKREGVRENLDGQAILNHIYDEIGDRVQYPAFYIGVLKRRKCSIGKDKVKWITSRAFHEVLGGDDEYLFVGDAGIKTGDFFRFYHSDSSIALSSCSNVSDHLRRLKPDCSNHPSVGPVNSSKKDIFGGIIFSCCGRGESLFGNSNVDSSPMLENFPGITLAGSFCGGEIARGDSSWYSSQESQEQGGSVSCCLHVFSTVYLVMSYTPPPPQS